MISHKREHSVGRDIGAQRKFHSKNSDSKIMVKDDMILVQPPDLQGIIVIDIENEYDDWASIPWG